MDSSLIFAGIVVLVIVIIIIAKAAGGGKSKKAPAKSKKRAYKTSIEIDPDAIVAKIFKLAPSELKNAKDEFIGREVEIRTIFRSSKGSKKGGTYREVLLDYQDNRNIHIIGDINMRDYDDQSWMTKEGKLKVRGSIKDIQPKEIHMNEIKFI